MYEYMVHYYKLKEAEDKMNYYASDGWRVISVVQAEQTMCSLIVTYEREVDSLIAERRRR